MAVLIAIALVVSLWSLMLSRGAERAFNPRTVIDHAFPAITNAPVVPAEVATARLVREEELVLGVVVSNATRAYPINMLTGPRREIINDILGGRPITATW